MSICSPLGFSLIRYLNVLSNVQCGHSKNSTESVFDIAQFTPSFFTDHQTNVQVAPSQTTGGFLCSPLAVCEGNDMRFYLFERQAEAHIRRSREYLEEANVRRVEHQAAAEHHNALAEMYASRIARIQAEMGPAFGVHAALTAPADDGVKESVVRSKSDSVVNYPYPARSAHA